MSKIDILDLSIQTTIYRVVSDKKRFAQTMQNELYSLERLCTKALLVRFETFNEPQGFAGLEHYTKDTVHIYDTKSRVSISYSLAEFVHPSLHYVH